MVKIEKLNDSIVTINGFERVMEGQLITRADLETLNVEKGFVTYSIDEKEIITIEAAPVNPPSVVAEISDKVSDSGTSLFLEAELVEEEPSVPLVTAVEEVKPEPKKVTKHTTSKTK